MNQLPVYAKALIAAIGSAATAVLPYVTDQRWAGWIAAAVTVAAVFGYPNAPKPQPAPAPSPPAPADPAKPASS